MNDHHVQLPPGMPARPYDVQIFQRDGTHRVYASR